MSTQPTQADQRVIGELISAFRKRNGKCLCPGSNCPNKPIQSHVVSEKTLRLIAENTPITVLTWNLRDDTMVKRLKARLPLEQFYFEPTSVGVRQKSKVTCPLFCEDHDGPIFAPLEQGNLSSQPGLEQRHEQILISQDYQQVDGKTFLVNIPPCIACTYALVPSDPLDAIVTINGSQTLTAQDVVVFSFLPYPPLHSLFVISWLRGSQRARVLLNNIINPLPEKEQLEFFLSLGFQASNVYISPTWWKSLSQEQKEYYTKLHLEAGREFAAYV